MIDTRNPSIEFNAYDRCDRCGAQAYSAAKRDGLELLFCLHHGKEHNPALELDEWVISYDYSAIERLTDTDRVNA